MSNFYILAPGLRFFHLGLKDWFEGGQGDEGKVNQGKIVSDGATWQPSPPTCGSFHCVASPKIGRADRCQAAKEKRPQDAQFDSHLSTNTFERGNPDISDNQYFNQSFLH